jgi:hypothetical protein
VVERGILKSVEILPLTDLIKIDATYKGTILSGLMFSREEYQGSLYRKLKENIGKPLEEVGNIEVSFWGQFEPVSYVQSHQILARWLLFSHKSRKVYGVWWWKATMIHSYGIWEGIGIFCRFWKHLHSLIGELTCDAFPEGIPRELTSELILHNKPMLGQKNDIVFAPRYKWI